MPTHGVNAATLIAAPRELVTPRLRLRAPHRDMAAVVVESINTSLATLGFITWGQQAHDLAWGERFCENGLKYVESGDCLIFYVFTRGDDASYVGRIDLHSFDFDAPRCEIGYVGDVRCSGQGLMREAVLAVVDLAFQLGFVRVQALSEVANERAVRFAEQALGFTREGVLRHFERDAKGALSDQVMLAAYAPRDPV
jgi:RimJ/RimL family protein N-acetyltransferase